MAMSEVDILHGFRAKLLAAIDNEIPEPLDLEPLELLKTKPIESREWVRLNQHSKSMRKNKN
jgi:hypothetical protein